MPNYILMGDEGSHPIPCHVDTDFLAVISRQRVIIGARLIIARSTFFYSILVDSWEDQWIRTHLLLVMAQMPKLTALLSSSRITSSSTC